MNYFEYKKYAKEMYDKHNLKRLSPVRVLYYFVYDKLRKRI